LVLEDLRFLASGRGTAAACCRRALLAVGFSGFSEEVYNTQKGSVAADLDSAAGSASVERKTKTHLTALTVLTHSSWLLDIDKLLITCSNATEPSDCCCM
jgi:malic enzyme